MIAKLFILISIVVPEPAGGSGGGGGPTVICCHVGADGNQVCTLPGVDGCESGDKAVVCRYGVWSDPESGTAECLPNGYDSDPPTPEPAAACDVAICCDYCQSTGADSSYCRGCESAGGDGCETGQTELDCGPGLCYSGAAKLSFGSWGNNACE